ncbi:MAG TPA: YciI family protein [Kofleriaceae bacterium]|nr:YciI family protein [Kofleriaceae bacterium]
MKVMVIIKANKKSEAGELPSDRLLSEMTTFNEELVRSGIMLDGNGLHPSAKGARVRFTEDGRRTVIDGPFAEAKELVAGYWILQVKTLQEAIEWVKRIPNPDNEPGEVEIRPVFEMEDFTTASDETRARVGDLERELEKQQQARS